MATDQPRDLAAEVERIASDTVGLYPRSKVDSLLQHIAALTRDLEELDRRVRARPDCEAIDMAVSRAELAEAELARLRAENELLREALRWVLTNGVVMAIHHIEGNRCPRLVNGGDCDSAHAPAHLRVVLEKAMEGKS